MYKDQIKLVTEYYNETKDNNFTGFKYIAWLEKNLTESRDKVKKLNIDDVSKPLHNCECDNQFPQGMTMCINCNGEVR